MIIKLIKNIIKERKEVKELNRQIIKLISEIDEVVLNSISVEEIEEEEEEEVKEEEVKEEEVKEKCNIDTCNGECQGMGHCETAIRFRMSIFPKFNNKPHPIGCKCCYSSMKINF